MSERPRNLTLQFLAEPADVNYGKVHGGAVMKRIDRRASPQRSGGVDAIASRSLLAASGSSRQ